MCNVDLIFYFVSYTTSLNKKRDFSSPDVLPAQHVEYVPLMHVDGDQRLEFGPLHLVKVLRCLANQRVQNVQEFVVRLLKKRSNCKSGYRSKDQPRAFRPESREIDLVQLFNLFFT